jgi:putative thioredoxin
MSFLDGATPPPSSDTVKEGSDQGFLADVIEPSRETPVIVDFWAPWCGPCKQLAPALEKAVRAAGGKVRLVKINIDEHPGVAGQLGVRSIPAVFAFDRGRPVDGFTGSIPESQIKLFVDRLSGAGAAEDIEALLADAAESLALNDYGGAAQAYAAALQLDAQNVKAIAGLARVSLATGETDQARRLIESVDEEHANNAELAGVRAALDLADSAAETGDAAQLAKTVSDNPRDFQARYDFAGALAARGDLAGAVDQLLAIIEMSRDWNEDAARKQLIKIFDAAGAASEVAKHGRRRLSALLFS